MKTRLANRRKKTHKAYVIHVGQHTYTKHVYIRNTSNCKSLSIKV